MENNFNDDHFESFLQEQLQNHKMFPKDSVWREINHKLHGDKRWPALTFASFLIVGLTTLICIHFSNKQSIFFPKPALIPLASQKMENHLKNDHQIGSISYPKINFYQRDKLISSDKNSVIEASGSEELIATNYAKPSANLNDFTDDLMPEQENVIENNSSIFTPLINEGKNIEIGNPLPYNTESIKSGINSLNNLNTEMVNDASSSIVENHNSVASSTTTNTTTNTSTNELHAKLSNISSVKRNSKFNIQLYLAPSISYRKLGEDEAVIKGANNGPAGVSQVSDVNDVVRHKPSKGLEGGISMLYDIRKKLRVKAGFQFNVRQYSIDAYSANTEISSIALVQNDRIETLNTLVFIRNYNGNSSKELLNRYYQLSLPLGLEWEVVGNKKISFNIAGSIQPTYIINRNAYLLTTNFKNYTENSDFVRKWNVNTNFEAFVSLKVGDVKWQLGPQIRYQPNSTFISRYPIYEHLIDYGIKLGISTNIK